MPELPDLEYIAPRLDEALKGRATDAVRVKEPIVLRVTLPGDFGELLTGHRFEKVAREGHFLVFDLDGGLRLVMNLMLVGRFRLCASDEKTEGALCFALKLGGDELRYLDEMKMGKAYLLRRGDEAKVPVLTTLGVPLLSKEFTLERFRKLIAKRRDQVRVFLMDKEAIASIGNAYADEILYEARLHPKTRCNELAPEQVEALYRATVSVMRWAIEEVRKRQPELHEKERTFLKVRNRKGERCPRCGGTIRETHTLSAEAYYCPDCQPATRALFVDWRKKPEPPPEPERAPDLEPTPPAKKRARKPRAK
ncbi:MAG: Fpg/Nei family DNA glycosylase [Myxococcales bacterium]